MEDLQITIDWENRTATVVSDDLATETVAVVEVDKIETATVLDVQKKEDENVSFSYILPICILVSVFIAVVFSLFDS